MNRKLTLLLCSVWPICCSAQLFSQPDSIEAKIWTNDCEDKVFARVEILPSIKGGFNVLEDSLSGFLKSENIFQNDARIKFQFTVSTNAQILGLMREENSFKNPELIEKFIKSHHYMWKAAIQNERYVCAMIQLEIEIVDNKLRVKIKQ